MQMGVVADDITGSNDIGIMFAKGGYLTHVYTTAARGAPPLSAAALQTPHVAILDTNSRLDSAQEAYEKVFNATRTLQEAGCRRFYNKTCSVFRGNIGAEFDAMLDALDEDFAVVVLGFPKNGRTTVNGIHYVHGKKLEESEFRNDPIHPMRRSDLVGILSSQTERPVALLDHTVVSRGSEPLRAAIDDMRDRCTYLILDVIDQDALRTIAGAVHDLPVLCGSSALAEELPAVWPAPEPVEAAASLPPQNDSGVLVAAGSLMPQTRAQLQHLKELGLPCFVLDPQRLFDPVQREAQVQELANEMAHLLAQGKDVVLQSPNDSAAVAQTRELGRQAGLEPTVVARTVSETLAEAVERVVRNGPGASPNRLVIAGGETSAAISERLGVYGLRIWKEIQPGLPSCISLNEPPLLLVLKSGSFGSADFLEQAVRHVREQ